MGVLKYSDLFLVNRYNSPTISHRAQVAQMKEYFGKGVLTDGVIEEKVSVLSPADGAGLGPEERYLVSDVITDVYGPGSFVLETDDIKKVGDSIQTSTLPGPNQNGDVSNAGWPTDLFNERHINAYNALGDTDDIQNAGNFVGIYADSGVNTAHMLLTPGIPVIPTDVVQGNFKTYGEDTDIIFNETYVVAKGHIGEPLSYGRKKNQIIDCDLTEFFAAGETTITSIQVSSRANGDAGTGILAVLINGKLAGDSTVLSFPTDKNFDKWAVGEVVQSGSGWNQSQTWSDYAFADDGSAGQVFDPTTTSQSWSTTYPATLGFNGVYANNSGTEKATATGLNPSYAYFRPPGGISGITSIEVFLDATYSHTAGIDSNPTALATGTVAPNSGDGGSWISIPNPPASITNLWFKANPSKNGDVAIGGIKINNELLVDAQFSDPLGVKITSMNAKAVPDPTITVDGGSWYGIDSEGNQTGDIPNTNWYVPSEMWSDEVGGNVRSKEDPLGPRSSFNGIFGNEHVPGGCSFPTYPASGGSTQKWTAPIDFGPNPKVRIWTELSQGAGILNVNNSPIPVEDIEEHGWTTVTVSTLDSVEWGYSTPINAWGISGIEVNDKILVDSYIPNGGQEKLVKELPYDYKVTVDTTKDIDNPAFSGDVFMTDDNGDGPFTQSPYTLTTNKIASVDSSKKDFSGLVSDWTHNLTGASHYPSANGPFDPVDNNYFYAYDVSAKPINDRVNAYAELDFPVSLSPSNRLEIGWQGDGYTNYGSTQIDFLDSNGNSVLNTLFDNPSNSTTTTNKVTVASPTGVVTKIRLTIRQSETQRQAEYLGGLSGIWIDGVKFVAGKTYSRAVLKFEDPISDNPDLQYFKKDDVVQGGGMSYSSALAENSLPSSFVDGTETTETVVSLNPSTVTFNPPLDWDTKLEIWTRSGVGDAGGYFSVNGGPEVLVGHNRWGDITPVGETSGTISTITLKNGAYPDTTNQVNRFNALRINGVIVNDPSLADAEVKVVGTDIPNNTMVVDGGSWYAQPPVGDGTGDADGETVVTYNTTGGQGDIVTIDGKDLYLTDTGTRDSRWIAENIATTPFYVGTPSKITGESLDKDDVQFISWNGDPETIEFTADPPDSVDLVKRHWYFKESSTLEGLNSVRFTKYTETLSVTEGQDPGPWTQNVPELKYDYYYEIAVQYEDSESQLEPPQIINNGMHVGNRFKIAKRTGSWYPVSSPITDINSYDGTLSFTNSSELAGMEGEMVMVTDTTDDSLPPEPVSYTPVTSTIASVGSIGGTGVDEYIDPVYYADWTNVWEIFNDASVLVDNSPVPGSLYGVYGYDQVATYTFANPITVKSTFRFYAYRHRLSPDLAAYVKVTGPGGSVDNKNQSFQSAWIPGTAAEVGGSISSISTETPPSTGGNHFYALEVDGVLINPANISLTFDSVSPNPDLKYFQPGDVVQGGGTWNGVATPEQNAWKGITYGNGKFVAVSDDGDNRVMHSPDGINWTEANGGTSLNTWTSVTYGNGTFVAVSSYESVAGDLKQVMYSTDAITWTLAESIEPNFWYNVTYGDGKFVAVAYSGTTRAMYSTDGITWSPCTNVPAAYWTAVAYGNGKYVAVGGSNTSGVSMVSTDGISWTDTTGVPPGAWEAIAYGNGIFVATGYHATAGVMYSSDGVNWTTSTPTSPYTWRGLAYGRGRFVAVAYDAPERIMYSSDAITWTKAEPPQPTAGSWAIVYGGDRFVSVARDGTNRSMWSYTGTGADDEVKVVGTNIPDNTMVVDGGHWYAQPPVGDGTGDDDGETFVTGPAKSGTATEVTFDAATLNGITLTDSNHEWIDNTNRLGQNFYMAQVNRKYTGTTFYNAKEHRLMNDTEISFTHGRNGPIPELGIYELSETLRGSVIGFNVVDDKAEPIYDLVPQVKGLMTRLGL